MLIGGGMEYNRDENDQIRADFSWRIGQLVSQYENSENQVDNQFEVTLYVIALQSLVTQFQEFYRAMSKSDQNNFDVSEYNTLKYWEISEELIEKDTFGEKPLTFYKVFCHIRNALSHPTALDPNSSFPSTGYTTIPDASKNIKTICFIDSPETKENRMKRLNPIRHDEIITQLKKLVGIVMKTKNSENGETYYQPEKDGIPFARIFQIEIPVSIMRNLVLRLSDYLANPLQTNWGAV